MTNLPLKPGTMGHIVAHLHALLQQLGFHIPATDIEQKSYGPATQEAVQKLQLQHGLHVTGVVNDETANKLATLTNSPSLLLARAYTSVDQSEHNAMVRGRLVDEDGEPIASTTLKLFAKNVRNEAELGEATTGDQGDYLITYLRPSAFNLVVRAYDASGNVIAQSVTVFAAATEVEIDITTAASGVIRAQSTLASVSKAIAAHLQETPFANLKENKDTHELQFLASATGIDFTDVARLYIANALGSKHQINAATFFGIFSQSVPTTLNHSLAALPVIDDAFMDQALNGVLAYTHSPLGGFLTGALKENFIPASYTSIQDSELARLDTLRTERTGNAPYLGGIASLNEILSAGGVAEPAKVAFARAYADHGGHAESTWKTLRASDNLPADDVEALNTTLRLGELLAGHLPLIKDALNRLSKKELAGVQDLALLDESDWAARLATVDPQAASIPPEEADDTPHLKTSRFAKKLAKNFESRYPTAFFLGRLANAATSSFSLTKDELVAFLAANPAFSFKDTHIDHLIATSKATISPSALHDLKKMQRLHRVGGGFAAVDALNSVGYQSAQDVYFEGRGSFLAKMTPTLGESQAKLTYARAQMTYAAALVAFGRYNAAVNKISPAALASVMPAASLIAELPDLQALFGSLDYFQCEDCQSVYSPAAYLTDLLQYLGQFSASGFAANPSPKPSSSSTPNPNPNARDALFLRRPDIQYIALDCNNTNVTLPYIDLVNEIFEAAIAPPGTPVAIIDTIGTSDERRALPQNLSQTAYSLTAGAVFPLSLPFDLSFAQTTAYINALGTTRATLLALFGGNSVSSTASPAIAAASLGVNPEMQQVINGSDRHQPWDRWGLAQNPPQVIDPNTRVAYLPNPADWVAALSKVPVLLNRAGLTIQQLYQLLEVVWVTQSSVTLQAGSTTSAAGAPILSADTDLMVFSDLTSDVLDRANRFLRLWTASGLQMWELDWALEAAAGGLLNDAFLVFLAGAMTARDQLHIPFQEILGFWTPLETRDVTNHLGDEDTVVPSTYSEIFRNAAVLLSWSNVFVPLNQSTIHAVSAASVSPIAIGTAQPHLYQTGMKVAIAGVLGNTAANGTFTITVTSPTTFTLNGVTGNGTWTSGGIAIGVLSGNVIIPAPSAPPTPEQSAISAALGLSAGDISAILAATGAANALSLDTLNVLLQFQRLASSLSLSISDLILWIALTAGEPFKGAPADTLEFLRRLAVLQGIGLAVYDLDYLLRGQSASRSSIAFTAVQATAVLQTIGDAIVKLPGATTIPIAGASNTSPILVNTASPNGLQTGTQVSITGVAGNTSTNGTFIITITGPTSFTLNGSTGNGNWTGGGTLTFATYDANAIEAVFIGAIAAAISTTANVVTPLLVKTGVLPLSATTINALVADSAGVDATQFPTLINAFTSVAKGAALFSALNPAETEFAFVVQNAGTFNWLDPSALPLSPSKTSPYTLFEALLRALRLNKRQPARTPKLFDILAQLLPPNSVPTDLQTAIGGPTINIIAASNAAPIAITTASPHGLRTGIQVTISGVIGNYAANGIFTITVTGPATFTLNGSSGSGAWTGGGTAIIPCLAIALDASINDVIALANALSAKPPTLTLSAQPGSLADMAMLTSIADALDVMTRYGIGAPTLVQLAAAPAQSGTVAVAISTLQAQYPQSAWFGAIQPVEDVLRQNRRDALVAYLLGPGAAQPASPVPAIPQMLTTDDIFDYYLIDPEMSPCAVTTRLLQASLTIQQFVQQCFLNLFFSGASVDMSNSHWGEWSWRQQYRLWQANREVFLYPENYVLPETRTDASSFFTDLGNDLRQGNYDADSAQTGLENYLRKLVTVANLQVAAYCPETKSDGSTVLHVFARTPGATPDWYYRSRTGTAIAAGSWTAWEQLNLDIDTQHVIPVIWDKRLCLVWAVFQSISQAPSDQTVPASSSSAGTQSAPKKFWGIQFAMSELSAGQWQTKTTFMLKVYSDTQDSPLNYTFVPTALGAFFAIQIFRSGFYLADVIISAGQSSLLVFEQSVTTNNMGGYIDRIQEPLYPKVFSTLTDLNFLDQLTPRPITWPNCTLSGQDQVYGTNNPLGIPGTAPVTLTVYQSLGGGGITIIGGNPPPPPVTIELLATIQSPRVVKRPESNVDFTDPFFVADFSRTYLVQQQYVTDPTGATNYIFETCYHPYAQTLLRQLESSGISGLMSRNLQLNPQTVRGWTPTFDFKALYSPTAAITQPYPGAAGASDAGESALDFAVGSSGAFSLYNWEIFYHIPMFMASLLSQNQQYQDAQTWLEYIFNPTDTSGEAAPQRFWQMAPFNADQANWTSEEIQNILTTGINDASTAAALNTWIANPFDPHAIASLRISAYAKATVMKFLDNLIAWGDSYYSQYTAELVSQAEQLYILADLILGPRPQTLRLPNSYQNAAATNTYASLQTIDTFSNVLVNIENVIVAPEPPQSIVEGTAATPSLPALTGTASTSLFCIPPNNQLLAYWDTVSLRLSNIRNCRNIQGVVQPLPLYAPPINPLLAAEELAQPNGPSSTTPSAPIYRFSVYMQKAIELTNDVRSYGSLILSALEKQDAEALSVLRANQELDIQSRMLDVKMSQVTEAQDQITALQNQVQVVQIRHDYYAGMTFMNVWETSANALLQQAVIKNTNATSKDKEEAPLHLLPSFSTGVSGWGGTPKVTGSFGGENLASFAAAWSSIHRSEAGILSEQGGIVSTQASYWRRLDDWTFQVDSATAELTQLGSQIAAATDRLNTANNELAVQQAQISNAQAVSVFLTNKYTNAQLYNWMISQLTTVYAQAYQLAFSLSLQTQNAYQYELGSQDTFLQPGYWDTQHKGLTAGESLLFDLRRMEAQYLAGNSRELELTKHVSLALTSPMSLVMLRETGTCQIALDEALFEYDHPGQYFRRLRSVALTVPCVTGPYTGVNATLNLTSAMVRVKAPGAGYLPQSATAQPNDATVIGSPMAALGTSTIATSHGQNDAGLFDTNLRDERWLPFEGQGAISTWNMVLDPRDNNFDFSTITDIIVHLRYTARGGDQTAAQNVRNALKPTTPRSILVSVRNTFGNAWYSFFNPSDTTATQQALTLPITTDIFPFSNLGSGGAKIDSITFCVSLTVQATGNTITASFNPAGGTLTAGSLVLGNPVGNALTAIAPLSPPAVAPQSFTVTVPAASVPPGLAVTVGGQTRLDVTKFEDILLVINYSIS